MMTREDLKDFAEKNKLPFSQVLGWYITGLTLYLTEETGFNQNLVLVEPFSLDPNQDIHILEDGIAGYYVEDERIKQSDGFVPGCPYSSDFTARLLLQIQNRATKGGYPLVIKVGTGSRVEFKYQDMYFPLEIRIRPKSDFYPEMSTFRFFDKNIDEIDVRLYPKENQAADYIMEILEKLELINEMEVYLYLYRFAKGTSLSARDVCVALSESEGDREPTWSSFEKFASYKNNSYMKKKWKVFLRRHRIKEPTWEETMDLLVKFIEPLWASLTKGELFFGDWMPELGRYLE